MVFKTLGPLPVHNPVVEAPHLYMLRTVLYESGDVYH
jgi:hypothetical protein